MHKSIFEKTFHKMHVTVCKNTFQTDSREYWIPAQGIWSNPDSSTLLFPSSEILSATDNSQFPTRIKIKNVNFIGLKKEMISIKEEQNVRDAHLPFRFSNLCNYFAHENHNYPFCSPAFVLRFLENIFFPKVILTAFYKKINS